MLDSLCACQHPREIWEISLLGVAGWRANSQLLSRDQTKFLAYAEAWISAEASRAGELLEHRYL